MVHWGGLGQLEPSGGWRHAYPPEPPRGHPGSSRVCWQQGHGNSQGLAVASTQRRSHLSKPPGTSCERRTAGAHGGHAPSHASVAASLGAPARDRAAAPRGRSKNQGRRRGSSSVSRRLGRVWACPDAPRGGNNMGACARSFPGCSTRCTPLARRLPTTTCPWCITASRRGGGAAKRCLVRPWWGWRP